jgi:serine/threonine-protein kinase HipA
VRDTTSIQVFADWKGLEQPTLMGTLEVAFVRGKEVFSFEYDTDWLQTKRYLRSALDFAL